MAFKRIFELAEERQGKPYTHPEIAPGHRRVQIGTIDHSTDKAILITIFGTNRKVWIPRTCFTRIFWGDDSRGCADIDKINVVDVDEDFYDQNIA